MKESRFSAGCKGVFSALGCASAWPFGPKKGKIAKKQGFLALKQKKGLRYQVIQD